LLEIISCGRRQTRPRRYRGRGTLDSGSTNIWP
jgi:hypothetical protein